MKELFHQLSHLFNFGKENRMVNFAGPAAPAPVPEAPKKAPKAVPKADEAVPSAEEAPAQVDRDVEEHEQEGKVVYKGGKKVIEMSAVKIVPSIQTQVHVKRMKEDPNYAKIYKQYFDKWAGKRGEGVAGHMVMAVADRMIKGASSLAARKEVQKIVGKSKGVEAYDKLVKAGLFPETEVAEVPTTEKGAPVKPPKLARAVDRAREATKKGLSVDEMLAKMLQKNSVSNKLNVADMGDMLDDIQRVGKRVPAEKFPAFSKAITNALDSWERAYGSGLKDRDLRANARLRNALEAVLDKYSPA